MSTVLLPGPNLSHMQQHRAYQRAGLDVLETWWHSAVMSVPHLHTACVSSPFISKLGFFFSQPTGVEIDRKGQRNI